MVRFRGLTVYLNVADPARSRRFYEGLGLKVAQEFPEMRTYVFRTGDASIVVGPAEPAQDEATRRWLAQKPWGTGVVVMPSVDDVDALHETAKRMGAEIEEPPTDQPWGSRTVRLVDPDGYSLMFEREPRPARPAKAARKAAKKAEAARGGKATKKAGRKAGKKARR